MKGYPYYYETDTPIFVHTRIDEESGEYWKWGVEDYYFCFKYPHSLGSFYKDIIAGYIFTSKITENTDYHRIYWDGANHFYIDGQTEKSGVILVLEFANQTNSYLGYEKVIDKNKEIKYIGYHIK